MKDATIIYTLTDEAPALATYSLLPIVQTFAEAASISVETRDISLAGRILAHFPDALTPAQRQNDDLAELGELAKSPRANIIKLPNISASVPQLKAAIKELQQQGFAIPEYPEDPQDDAARSIKMRYAKVLGSAVNPVLREGNSDRRVANAVKQYAKQHPHSMGPWNPDSKTRVAHMSSGDFYGNEQAATLAEGGNLRIEFESNAGTRTVLKDGIKTLPGEIISTTFMDCRALSAFYDTCIRNAKQDGLLLSLHLKATMMKVSDPIMFGHAVKAYFRSVFDKHGATLARLGVNANNGVGDLMTKIQGLPAEERASLEADLRQVFTVNPPLAMVDSDRGITNLHVPSDVIIDASMPAAIRSSGRMWGPDGKPHDMVAMIPDRCYAGVYQAVIDDCRRLGAYHVPTMGSVSNVGLMAQAAEEYGSHDKTFELPTDGTVRVLNTAGRVLTSHTVRQGDIWRMCQTKDVAIRDWVKLAVQRARVTGAAAMFWLDDGRAYDRLLIDRVQGYLKEQDTRDLDIRVLSPVKATEASLERLRAGIDTISVTGNVLRDYLTDLFPILELGTSAKMLSIVPLLAGGGMYETGAGGSAPKHVQQFVEEGHLRWDSLGEFLALQVSMEELSRKSDNRRGLALAAALDAANGRFLAEDKSPSRKTGELDVRGSHFYLALYWALAVAAQTTDLALAAQFKSLAAQLAAAETTIVAELNGAQGHAIDIGGYYHPDAAKCAAAMRPSKTFNDILNAARTAR